MEKRYQVFVSSTYTDLQDERRQVIQALMEMDCIPAGMELFPAADEEQWKFIQKVIDDCDYYLLIIGARYGSLSSDGISFTEKEFDYAVSKGMDVLAFIHSNPGSIATDKSEIDPTLREKLDKFRKKISTNRLVKQWTNSTELPGLVALSLMKTIKIRPAVGWVRANQVASGEALTDLNTLRKENADLREKISILEGQPNKDLNLASLDEEYTFEMEWEDEGFYEGTEEVTASWRTIFSLIAPLLMNVPSDLAVNRRLAETSYEARKGGSKRELRQCYVKQFDFETIRTQLIALQLVKVKKGVWTNTDAGDRLLFETRTVKAAVSDEPDEGSPASSDPQES